MHEGEGRKTWSRSLRFPNKKYTIKTPFSVISLEEPWSKQLSCSLTLDSVTSDMQDRLHHVLQAHTAYMHISCTCKLFSIDSSRSLMDYIHLLYSGCDTISSPGCSGRHIDPMRGRWGCVRDRNICYVLTASNMHGRPPVASRPRYNFAAAKVFNKEAFLSYENFARHIVSTE